MAQDLPPVPYGSPIADQSAGTITSVWSDWFRKALDRMGGNVLPESQAASGYVKLPNGLYLQWGVTASIATATNTVITFPVAFPSVCFQVISGIFGNGSGGSTATGHFGTSGYSKTGFTLNNRTSADYAFNWFAIGN